MLFREGNGTPLQSSWLENPMDRGAWWAAVHGVTKSRTRLSDFTFTFQFHALEKEMATHASVLAWRIPGMGEPGGLLSCTESDTTGPTYQQQLMLLFHLLPTILNFKDVSVQFSSLAQLCLTVFDPMNCSTPGLTVHH